MTAQTNQIEQDHKGAFWNTLLALGGIATIGAVAAIWATIGLAFISFETEWPENGWMTILFIAGAAIVVDIILLLIINLAVIAQSEEKSFNQFISNLMEHSWLQHILWLFALQGIAS
jgi:hypothetical protein